MKHVFWAAVAAMSLAACGAPSTDGPFGIEAGTPIEKLQVVWREKDGDLYEVVPPKKHPDIAKVFVRAHPKAGVCEVTALTRESALDENALNEIDRLAEELALNYGEPTSGYQNREEAIRQWSTENREEAFRQWSGTTTYRAGPSYFFDWDSPRNAKEIDGIQLWLRTDYDNRATDSVILYTFRNYKQCSGIKRKPSTSASPL